MFQLRYWNSEFLPENCCVWIQLVAAIILLRRVTGPFWTIESKNRILRREILLAEEFGRKGSTLIFVHPCMYRHIYVHIYTCLCSSLSFSLNLSLQSLHWIKSNILKHDTIYSDHPLTHPDSRRAWLDCGFCTGEVAQSTKLKNAIMEVFSVLTWRQWRPPDFVVRIEWSLRFGLARLRLYRYKHIISIS